MPENGRSVNDITNLGGSLIVRHDDVHLDSGRLWAMSLYATPDLPGQPSIRFYLLLSTTAI